MSVCARECWIFQFKFTIFGFYWGHTHPHTNTLTDSHICDAGQIDIWEDSCCEIATSDFTCMHVTHYIHTSKCVTWFSYMFSNNAQNIWSFQIVYKVIGCLDLTQDCPLRFIFLALSQTKCILDVLTAKILTSVGRNCIAVLTHWLKLTACACALRSYLLFWHSTQTSTSPFQFIESQTPA